jgi:hypothetical protein
MENVLCIIGDLVNIVHGTRGKTLVPGRFMVRAAGDIPAGSMFSGATPGRCITFGLGPAVVIRATGYAVDAVTTGDTRAYVVVYTLFNVRATCGIKPCIGAWRLRR